MTISLKGLRVFIAVAEAGNIMDAAERVGRGPSTVSMALKQLEDELGAPLFESDRKNRLTPLGRFTLETMRGTLERYDAALEQIQDFARGRLGRLAVACVPSVGAALLPQAITAFLAEHPRVELDIRDTDSAAVEAAVRNGGVDLGVAGRPADETGLTFTPLFEDPFVLVCHANHPLAAKPDITVADLEPHRLIANGAMAQLRLDGKGERPRLLVRNMASLLALLRGNAGVTLLPLFSVPADDGQLVTRPLKGGWPYRQLGILRRADENPLPAATAFMAILVGCAGELDPRPGTIRTEGLKRV